VSMCIRYSSNTLSAFNTGLLTDSHTIDVSTARLSDNLK